MLSVSLRAAHFPQEESVSALRFFIYTRIHQKIQDSNSRHAIQRTSSFYSALGNFHTSQVLWCKSVPSYLILTFVSSPNPKFLPYFKPKAYTYLTQIGYTFVFEIPNVPEFRNLKSWKTLFQRQKVTFIFPEQYIIMSKIW